MPGNKVETDPYPTFMSLDAEGFQIVVCSVSAGNLIKISHVVTSITKRGDEDRIKPDSVTTDRSDVIEFLRDARKVTNSVTIRIEKALRINLIKDSGFQPCRTKLSFARIARSR
jgi:hypothetical protein